MTWLLAHWKSLAAVIGLVAIWMIIITVLNLKPDKPLPVEPAVPHVEAVKIDTTATQSTSTVKSDNVVKRKVKVKITLPPETVIGDSACTIEVVVEDSSGNEVAVEDIVVEDKGLKESVTVCNQEVVPVKKERAFGVLAGVGYLIPDNDVVPVVGVGLRVWDPVYVHASAGFDRKVIWIGGVGVRVGRVFGLPIIVGAGYCSDGQGVITLSI